MGTLRSVLRLVLALWPLLAWAQTANAQALPGATAELRSNTGESIATVSFAQAQQEVLISIAFANRTALVGSHAIQIESASECGSAGAVLVALPNLVIGPAGVAVYNLAAPGANLNAMIGKSLVVFDQADAAVGRPFACGVILASGATPLDRPDPLTSVVIALVGGLLIVGGVLLRRSA